MALPIYKDTSQTFMLLQTNWKSQLDPILSNPTIQNLILKNVLLINGTTVINHLLGHKLRGWKIVRQRAAASIYDNQDSNQTPQLTLILISDAAVSVDLEVF